MTKRVVDQLEVIEINEYDSDDAVAPLRTQHHFAQPVVHHQSVGQVRDNIVISKML